MKINKKFLLNKNYIFILILIIPKYTNYLLISCIFKKIDKVIFKIMFINKVMDLEFQIYDYLEDHDSVDNDNNNKCKPLGDYIIHVFGRTSDDKSVYAKVTGYTPYFYIALPSKWEYLSKTDIKNRLVLFEKWLKSYGNSKLWSQYKETLIRIDYVKSKKPEGFNYDIETKEETKFNFARLVFNNSEGMKKYASFFEYNLVPPIYGVITKQTKFKLYEANLLPMLRCFHIRNISGCSWVSIDSNKYNEIDDNDKKSYCDIEIDVDWGNLNPIKKDTNAPFKIASFDIEVFSHDGQFPQADRKLDRIIQIGITYTRLGQSIPYRKWIACLKKTDSIQDIDLVSFENEDELIDAFIAEIIKYDCDIITGYNIFGFDEKYIYDRCEKILNMKSEMAFISKLKDRYCNFKEMKLSSSALGENILKFWETPGRVHIDLLKEVQKTYTTLPSFKLDFVSSNFIRGEIESYESLDNNQFSLKSKTINDIQIGDYIHIEVIKGFISDDIGDKYLVINIDKDTKTLYINGDSILDFIFGDAGDYANKITYSIPASIANPINIPFDPNILKEILSANKDAENGKLSISTEGLMKLEFQSDDLKVVYYIVRKQNN